MYAVAALPLVKTETPFVVAEESLLGDAVMFVKIWWLESVALFLRAGGPLVVDAVSVLIATTEAVFAVAE